MPARPQPAQRPWPTMVSARLAHPPPPSSQCCKSSHFSPWAKHCLEMEPDPRPWGLTPSPTAPRAHGPPAPTSTWPFLCPENYSCWLPPTCRPPGPPLALGQVLTLNRPVPLLTRALGSWGIKVRLESPVPGAAPGTYTLAESTNGDRGMERGKTSLRGRRGTGERLTQLSPQP